MPTKKNCWTNRHNLVPGNSKCLVASVFTVPTPAPAAARAAHRAGAIRRDKRQRTRTGRGAHDTIQRNGCRPDTGSAVSPSAGTVAGPGPSAGPGPVAAVALFVVLCVVWGETASEGKPPERQPTMHVIIYH
eukprot:gene17214-biopygen23328